MKAIGTNQKVMGIDAILSDVQVRNGVQFELYTAADVSDERAIVRVLDADTGDVVAITKYPTLVAAKAGLASRQLTQGWITL